MRKIFLAIIPLLLSFSSISSELKLYTINNNEITVNTEDDFKNSVVEINNNKLNFIKTDDKDLHLINKEKNIEISISKDSFSYIRKDNEIFKLFLEKLDYKKYISNNKDEYLIATLSNLAVISIDGNFVTLNKTFEDKDNIVFEYNESIKLIFFKKLNTVRLDIVAFDELITYNLKIEE